MEVSYWDDKASREGFKYRISEKGVNMIEGNAIVISYLFRKQMVMGSGKS